jgi:hypothetical protein
LTTGAPPSVFLTLFDFVALKAVVLEEFPDRLAVDWKQLCVIVEYGQGVLKEPVVVVDVQPV